MGVQLITHEAQEAGFVGNPGNHQATGGGKQRNRKLFQLCGGEATIPLREQDMNTSKSEHSLLWQTRAGRMVNIAQFSTVIRNRRIITAEIK